MSEYLIPAIISYLIGSIPFSLLTAKYLGGIDIRNYGSGNTGATNVFRTLGKKAGAVAFLGDFLKGFIVAIIVRNLIGIDVAVICSFFAILGHCYPVFLGFKGGKGVATGAGTVFALYPIVGLILVFIFILIVSFSRIVSLASISAAVLFPILSYFMNTHKYFLVFSIFIGLFVVYRHKANIRRLISGNESKISFKSTK
ncbi:glycerol-3-phosphate 1-O-acyltransferase PlsY [Wukongibacter sp. M2B1]|uniref:glycerol-3-phosphate 1-O-acyltransferase PlsY n=1 Tax=Wukongibacter sp. M2B1 TaxID=3088895 RepID=UPI003D78D74A